MRFRMMPVLSLAIGMTAAYGADDLDAIRALIGEIKVKIEHTEELVKSEDGAKPPLKRDLWRFIAGGVNPTVCYSRYLNRPPDFTGSYPSLASGDMGLGLDGGPFGHWYRGSAIRVLLDGRDVFAEQPASRAESQESTRGHLRLTWELKRQRRLVLNLTVPDDGRAVFARVDIDAGEAALGRLELRLTAYPGGFGPAYSLPSHRYVRTAGNRGEVPRDFRHSPENPFPVLTLAESDDWVFYGDRLCSSGSLALLLDREEHPSGQVNLSSYGVSTSLTYPANTRQIHLAFFAFSLVNEAAERSFLAGLATERTALSTIPFWTEQSKPGQ